MLQRVLLLSLLATLLMASTSLTGAPRPNIILLMADDQGWGDAGYQGHPRLKTPGLDSMARDGMQFDRFYAAAPVCSPTRGSVLTGRHPYRYGIFFANTGHLLPRELTIAEILKPQGYATGHFGKWHLGTLTTTVVEANRGGPRGKEHFAPPRDHGFDVNFSTESKTPTYDPLLRPKTATGKQWWNPVAEASDGDPYGTHYWSSGQLVAEPLRGDDSQIIMDRAVAFIRDNARRSQASLTVIWFHAPHLPVVAADADRRPFSDQSPYMQHYLGCLTALDRQVARLRSELKALDIEDNTLLCYCSDNGPEGKATAPGSAKHLRGRKRSLYEGGIRVPGLMVWPGHIPAGMISRSPAVTSDYLPTILDLLEITMPDQRPLDGISLVPWFRDPTRRRVHGIGFESGQQAAWIESQYKLVATGLTKRGRKGSTTSSTSPAYELYDIREDPGETRDLSKHFPKVRNRLVAELAAWRASCAASLARRPE